ncbi:MAG: DUF1844 domain-containing protein [Candidatus Omnitrophica bacterium]|nr:DUF1844 domain-containing protein [Candidatus Omnitrophota bacterium]
MTDPKDIHFTEKKVDDGWKNNVEKEKVVEGVVGKEAKTSSKEPKKKTDSFRSEGKGRGEIPKITFGIFITSLGFQALIHLGEIEHPETKRKEKNLDAARETIDLLVLLKEKTKNNCTPEEDKLLEGLIADLQIKYVSQANA